jgi:hypothetical protein
MSMNLVKIPNLLKNFSDSDLMNEARNPSGMIPSVLVFSELADRVRVRKAASQRQPPSSTVADDLKREAEPQAPQGIASIMPQQAPQGAIQEMARGGIVRMSNGGASSRISANSIQVADIGTGQLANYDPTSDEEAGGGASRYDPTPAERAEGDIKGGSHFSLEEAGRIIHQARGLRTRKPTGYLFSRLPEESMPESDYKIPSQTSPEISPAPPSSVIEPSNLSVDPTLPTPPVPPSSVIDVSGGSVSSGRRSSNSVWPALSSAKNSVGSPNSEAFPDIFSERRRQYAEERSAIDDLIKMSKEGRESEKDKIKNAQWMAVMNAGLNMMAAGAKTGNALGAIGAGGSAAMASLASDLKDIRKDQRENILEDLKMRQLKLDSLYREGSLDQDQYKTEAYKALGIARAAAIGANEKKSSMLNSINGAINSSTNFIKSLDAVVLKTPEQERMIRAHQTHIADLIRQRDALMGNTWGISATEDQGGQ